MAVHHSFACIEQKGPQRSNKRLVRRVVSEFRWFPTLRWVRSSMFCNVQGYWDSIRPIHIYTITHYKQTYKTQKETRYPEAILFLKSMTTVLQWIFSPFESFHWRAVNSKSEWSIQDRRNPICKITGPSILAYSNSSVPSGTLLELHIGENSRELASIPVELFTILKVCIISSLLHLCSIE